MIELERIEAQLFTVRKLIIKCAAHPLLPRESKDSLIELSSLLSMLVAYLKSKEVTSEEKNRDGRVL